MLFRSQGIRYVRAAAVNTDNYYQAAAKFVATEEWDWIVIYNRPKYLPLVAAAAPKSLFLLSMHNEMFQSHKIDHDLACLCLERVEKVITVSKFIADGIAKLFPNYKQKLQAVYAGVDLNRFQPRWFPETHERRAALLAAYNLKDKQVILSVGRLTDKKGPHLLLPAMEQVIQKHPSAVLLLVGSKWYGKNEDNEYVRKIKKQAEKLGDFVRLTGFISPDKIQDYFLLGDIFVCASQWEEPLARVHYESMATGLCTITTERGGNAEVIIPEKNGLVIQDYQNPDAFADKINYLLSRPKQREEMGYHGRSLAELYYGWHRVASDILNILK